MHKRVGIAAMVLAMATTIQSPAADKPNVLIIMADDATYLDLPLYGGTNVKTPNLDRFAAQGLRFTRAHLGMSMCVPCRAELNTGRYPMRNGVCWNHSSARPGVKSVCQHLGALGYRCGVAGKVHMTPRPVFPFEMVEGFERNCVAQTANHDCAGIREFMARDPASPFYLVVALVVPHAPWTVGNPEHFDLKALKLPPIFADTEETRRSYARYLAEIEWMDRQLGDILRTLDETGQAGRTLVLFSSEQGAQFPGCKWTNWTAGLGTALVARWPGQIAAGTVTDALVQYADVLPTLVEAAGGEAAAGDFDGRSFLGVLQGKKKEHRAFTYAMHNNVPEGPPYPVRSVSNGAWRYLRNLSPGSLYIEKHLMGATEHNPYWLTWVWASADNDHALWCVERFMRRPAEELYHTAEDPWELRNLAGDPAHAAVKMQLSAELDRWMQAQGDPGASLDTREAHQANRRAAQQKR